MIKKINQILEKELWSRATVRRLKKNIDKKFVVEKENLISSVNEIDLLLVCVSIIWIFFTDFSFRTYVFQTVGFRTISMYGYLILIIWGILLPLYYLFPKKKITRTVREITIISLFAVNAYTGVFSISYYLLQGSGWSLILPILNILYISFVILTLFKESLMFTQISKKQLMFISKIKTIPEQRIRIGNVAIGSAILITWLLLSQYILHIHWSVNLPICLSYSMILNSTIQNHIFKIR